ncbi:alpha/beta hydrolase-fold protein [Lutimonas vermicola]|uniref:Alpha/beta hydrolase-fold protein n=1 Tax=Lutimonas vermicola TaxID=414288 RepID=A0ABU9L4H9_9FLAO
MHIRLNFFIFLFLLSTSILAQQIKVSYSSSAFDGVFSGKVLLYLSKDGKTPKDLGIGLPTLSCFSIEVNQIKPNTSVLFNDSAISYPVKLSDIERGEYYVQAVWDRNTGGRNRNIGNSVGNMYSEAVKFNFTKDPNKEFSILCSEKITGPIFKETVYTKELKAPSPLLSAFYKQPTTVDAAVLLPKEYYSQSSRKFPVHFIVSGYGGDYHRYSDKEQMSQPLDTTACITVFLDGNCPTGHSTYANSDNNGPWGDALVNEFIPLLEKNYRCDGARLLSGHSSGGWTVLWLQANYPTTFAGCWSSSPDPVDFRNFQKVNLYADKNMYYDEKNELRLDATIAGRIPWIYLRDDYGIENVIYRGEQYVSWNAVWGKKAKDGSPEKICDIITGEIDSLVVAHWKEYDISLLIRNHWPELKPNLDNKIRVSAGNHDNYFLNQAVELLEVEMKILNANFVFEYYPGDHFTLNYLEYKMAGYTFLENKYATWLSKKSTLKE